MKKRSLFSLGIAVIFGFSLFTSSPIEAEELKTGKCSITITSDNVGDNYAQATGPCKGFIWGSYVPSDGSWVIDGSVTAPVHNGQKLYFHLPPTAGDYYNYELTVITIKKEKQEAPRTETPSQPKSSPGTGSKTKPSEGSNKSSGGKSSQSSSSNKNASSSKTSTSTPKSSTKSGTSNKSKAVNTHPKKDDSKSKVNVVNGQKGKTDNNKEPKVVNDGGKYFAVEGNVKKEITKDEAKEPEGQKRSQQQEEKDEAKEPEGQKRSQQQEEKIENTQITPKEENNNNYHKDKQQPEKENKVLPIALGSTVIAGATLGGLYYFHPSSRRIINKILEIIVSKVNNLFKH